MEIETSCRFISGMAFEAEINGHRLMMDADSGDGGNDLGPRPKPFLLLFLAGCSGMDVIAALKKMRYEPRYFNIITKGGIQEEQPQRFRSIHLIYEISSDVVLEHMEKAVNMSLEKLCGVYASLDPKIKTSYEIRLVEKQNR
jgi:putative redox protein